MSRQEILQHENGLAQNILDLLNLFRGFRKMSWAEIGDGVGFQATTLTKVFNGHQAGSEKLLHALESFFLLDNLH